MAPSDPLNTAEASSGSKKSLTTEEQEKYEDFIRKYSAMRSITNAPHLPPGLVFQPDTESNPLVIDDDDDYIQPAVFLRPFDHSEDEPPQDAPILQESNQVSAEEKSDSESTIPKESATTTYSSDGGFVVDDGAHDVFLHNHDTDFDPGSDSGSQNADVAQVDEVDSDEDGADADEDEQESDDDGSDKSPPQKKIRRDSAGF